MANFLCTRLAPLRSTCSGQVPRFEISAPGSRANGFLTNPIPRFLAEGQCKALASRGCVVIGNLPSKLISRKVRNLQFSISCRIKIPRVKPQDSIVTQSLKGEINSYLLRVHQILILETQQIFSPVRVSAFFELGQIFSFTPGHK